MPSITGVTIPPAFDTAVWAVSTPSVIFFLASSQLGIFDAGVLDMLFPYYLSIGFITRKGFVVSENNNDSVDDQYLFPRVMKGKHQGGQAERNVISYLERSKEVIWLQIMSAQIQRYVKDEASDHELTPGRTPVIGGYHSLMLCVDAQTSQSNAGMGWTPVMVDSPVYSNRGYFGSRVLPNN